MPKRLPYCQVLLRLRGGPKAQVSIGVDLQKILVPFLLKLKAAGYGFEAETVELGRTKIIWKESTADEALAAERTVLQETRALQERRKGEQNLIQSLVKSVRSARGKQR